LGTQKPLYFLHTYITQFHAYANEILDVSQINAKNIFASITSMSVSITSHALFSKSKWPFVSLPDFEAKGEQLVELSGALYFSLNPVVTEENREAWEEYTIQNHEWLADSLSHWHLQEMINQTIVSPFIYRRDVATGEAIPEDRPADPYYLPVWQVAPITRVPQLINYNAFDFFGFAGGFQAMVQSQDAALSSVINLADEITSERYNWPQSFLTAPIYDTLLPGGGSHISEEDNDIMGSRKLVAALSAILPWHNYFTNLLPYGVSGIYLVVRNSCAQVLTYQLDGRDVVYMGPGDLHDTSYDYLEEASTFATLRDMEGTTTVDDYCSYSLHVYPSSELQSVYRTNMPMLYTAAVVLIYLITSAFFVLYDILVQRRQAKVMDTAVSERLGRSWAPFIV
jgi:hypothetical protein